MNEFKGYTVNVKLYLSYTNTNIYKILNSFYKNVLVKTNWLNIVL